MKEKIFIILFAIVLFIFVYNIISAVFFSGWLNAEFEWNKHTVQAYESNVGFNKPNQLLIHVFIKNYNYPDSKDSIEFYQMKYMVRANGEYITGGSYNYQEEFQDEIDIMFIHNFSFEELPSDIQESYNKDGGPIEWKITGDIYIYNPDKKIFDIPLDDIHIQTK